MTDEQYLEETSDEERQAQPAARRAQDLMFGLVGLSALRTGMRRIEMAESVGADMSGAWEILADALAGIERQMTAADRGIRDVLREAGDPFGTVIDRLSAEDGAPGPGTIEWQVVSQFDRARSAGSRTPEAVHQKLTRHRGAITTT